jgi:hypothetical protein
MMSRLRILAVSTMVAAMSITGAAQAACNQAALAGVWKAYSAGSSRAANGTYIPYWTSCRIVINANGFIAPTRCVNSFNLNGNLTNGRIVLSSAADCAYSGQFTFAGQPNILRNMTLSRDRLTAGGVGVFNGGSFIFTMTRI